VQWYEYIGVEGNRMKGQVLETTVMVENCSPKTQTGSSEIKEERRNKRTKESINHYSFTGN
jgi:hypothetical protein